MAGAGGGPRFAAPFRALFPASSPPSLRGRGRASPPRPIGTPLCAPAAPSRAALAPRRPRSLRPRRRRPHFTSAAGRAPSFGGPLSASAAGRVSGRASGPGERAAPCAARLRERGLLPLRPSAPSPRAWPPLPGEEGEWSHRRHHRCRPPRSPAEGREGSAPRQDPPLGLPPPPPPLPSLPPRIEPPHAKRERESAGRPERMPPPEPSPARRQRRQRRRGDGRGDEREAAAPPPRGTVPGTASRWRCGRGGAASPWACPRADLVGVPTLNPRSGGSPHPSQSVGPPAAPEVGTPMLPPTHKARPRTTPEGHTVCGFPECRWLRSLQKVVPPQAPGTKV